MKTRASFAFSFIFLPLTLGTFINFIVVFVGLSFILRGMDFYTYSVGNVVMVGLAGFMAFVCLGFMMMTASFFREDAFFNSENRSLGFVGLALKLVWGFCLVITAYATYIFVLRFVIFSSDTLQLDRGYTIRSFPFTTFSARVDVANIALEQLLTLAAIAILIVLSPIFLSYLRDMD